MPKIERRYLVVDNLEVRAAKDPEDGPKIVGYAARFNKLSDDLGGFREKIKPGAFKESIRGDDVRALWNHNSDYVLGRTASGTLVLSEDKKGLKMEIDPPDTQWARDLGVSIERGDVSQVSFGFSTEKDSWNSKDKDNVIRTLEQVRLFDVSPVTYPAYPQTEVQMRSLENALTEVGIDTNQISRVLLKSAHGLEITDDDRRAVDEVIIKLRSIAPEQMPEGNAKTTSPEEKQESEQEQMPVSDIGIRERELDMLEEGMA